MAHRPPFVLTPEILRTCLEISRLIGKYEGLLSPAPQPHLRRQNRIKTIQGSLAIEGNTLSIAQITAVFENKRVIGDRREILEVRNAIDVYERAAGFNWTAQRDLLVAHGILMKELINDAGQWRSTNVGILKGSKVSHVAPKANRVPELMANLFTFLKSDQEIHDFVKACVFHYELEFIHPFTDGNGRIGRLWQHVILLNNHRLFEFIPIESIIRRHQIEYYRALEISDKKGSSTAFIEFSLRTILIAFEEFFEELRPEPLTSRRRLEMAREHFGSAKFARKDYILFFKTMSTATASRDLSEGVERKFLKKTGTKSLAKYEFKVK